MGHGTRDWVPPERRLGKGTSMKFMNKVKIRRICLFRPVFEAKN